ncbi:hypothetical protein [Bradyrhizobium sp. CCBAU 21360]|uniref:hypothetical protein n=1 Tax=Bradyrhizobium sp. CCBAU 21360 TaxID=1325081 RepID=UPI002306A735|nr:hypothetical protein [Bradyrhizobium sp. CCBAU 21360]
MAEGSSIRRAVSTASRRSFLASMAGALAAPMVIRTSRAAAKPDSLTLTGYGGTYEEVLIKAALDPFTRETGIRINSVPAPDVAKVKAQLLTGNVGWDVFDGAATTLAAGSRQGFWELLDTSIFDLSDMVIAPTNDTVPWAIYGSRGIQRSSTLENIRQTLPDISTYRSTRAVEPCPSAPI